MQGQETSKENPGNRETPPSSVGELLKKLKNTPESVEKDGAKGATGTEVGNEIESLKSEIVVSQRGERELVKTGIGDNAEEEKTLDEIVNGIVPAYRDRVSHLIGVAKEKGAAKAIVEAGKSNNPLLLDNLQKALQELRNNNLL